MFGSRSRGRTLPEHCAALTEAVLRRDERQSTKSLRAVYEATGRANPQELTAGAEQLVPALREVPLGNGQPIAKMVAAMIELGADPAVVLDVLAERLATGLEQAARFTLLAERIDGEVTAPSSPAAMAVLTDRVLAAAPAAGLEPEEAMRVTQAYLTVGEWVPSLLLPLQQKRGRAGLPQRDRLTAAAAAAEELVDDANWLLGLLLVLDDEPVIVVHRATGRVYDLTMSGVGDNFQLHTLLAATLIGDPADGLIPGPRPEPAWIAAATDGDWNPDGGIRGQFNLVDAGGTWIWNEGRPSDIPLLDGRRVIVLDPAPYERSWNYGRVYPLIRAEMTLNRVLPAGEATPWIAGIAPATS
jgi:hypothetical protein